MKSPVKYENLKYLALGTGGLGLTLRIALFSTGIDHKGLLVAGHWAGIALWVLTIAVAVSLFLLTRTLKGPGLYHLAQPASVTAGLGSLFLGVVIGITSVREMSAAAAQLQIIVTILGFAAAAVMVFVAFCRIRGMKPFFLCHAVLCIYFALRMVSQYQSWRSDPQLQDYVFYLGAYVALMLTAYHHAAFDADMGKHSSLWLLSLAAVYLCCLSLKGTRDTLLLLAAGVWAFSNLTKLTVKRNGLFLKKEHPQEEV